MQLLLIESSKSYSSLFQKLLEGSQISLTLADSLEQALNSINNRTFDIIYSSAMIGKHSATSFCKHLRESGENTTTPCVVYAANVTQERLEEYNAIGANGLVAKAELIQNLLNDIEKHRIENDLNSKPAFNIVHIEDDRVMQILMKNYLAQLDDINLSQFALGKEGIAYINEHCPDILLLDMNLPDSSGLEIATELKGMDRTKNFPIIAVTGEAKDQENRNDDSNLFAEIIQKPFDKNTIEQIIERFR